MKARKCVICKAEYIPQRMGQKWCTPYPCGTEYIRQQAIKDKPKKNNKPKQAKLSTLQKNADKLQSECIRLKHADEHGYVICVSCGRMFHWSEVDAGHFVPKSRGASVRYMEENVHPECVDCNRFNEYHLVGYHRTMIDLYGEDGIKIIENESKKRMTPSQRREYTLEAIERYTKELDKLKELKCNQ